MEEGANQCDGCRRGLLVRDGIHYDGDHPWIACTAARYPEAVPFRPKYPAVPDEGPASDWVYEYGKRMVEGDPEIPYADAVNIVRGVTAFLRAATTGSPEGTEDAPEAPPQYDNAQAFAWQAGWDAAMHSKAEQGGA